MTNPRLQLAMDRAPPGMAFDRFAFDLANRSIDADGRLHVRVNRISAARVNPYNGYEIPDYEALGLDPNKVYQLYRDTDELAKAAPTFNNIPLLSKHVPVTVDEPQKDLVVGSTGTDAEFQAPFLLNSLVVWDAEAIAGIESGQKKELSSAYRYVAVMEPGEHEGLRFDGYMVSIVANHLCLVEAGRAGSDVVVGDAALNSGQNGVIFGMKLNSRKATMASGALAALIRPLMAQDQKFDATLPLKGVTYGNFAAKKDAIYGAVVKATKGKLAQDADISGVVDLLDAFAADPMDGAEADLISPESTIGIDDEDPNAAPAVPDPAGDDVVAKIMAFLQGKLTPEDMAALGSLVKPPAADPAVDPAMDEPPPFEGSPTTQVDKPAMDAAIKAALTQASKNHAAVRQAEKDVRPYIGDLAIAMDSAADIYRMALEKHDVDLTGVHASAFPALLKMIPVPGSAPARVAMDAAPDAGFATRYPTASRIRKL